MGRREVIPCIHRWVLGEPRKGAVEGICRRCGARRTYPAGLEFVEAVPDYEELAASRPVLAAERLTPEEHALV